MRQRRDPAAVALVEECVAFLEGRHAELVEATGATVPVWAWLNLLGHGTEADLRDAVGELSAVNGWRQARAFLAGEILDVVENCRVTLGQLQREVLVPLELDVIDCRCDQWTPGRLVRGLLAVLPHAGSIHR